MDPAHTTLLVGVRYLIHLYTPLFYRPFYFMLIGLGRSLGYAVQEKETEDLIFSVHDIAGDVTLGPFAINVGTKLVNKQSNSNTFEEP